jgi:hypothetical protein
MQQALRVQTVVAVVAVLTVTLALLAAQALKFPVLWAVAAVQVAPVETWRVEQARLMVRVVAAVETV